MGVRYESVRLDLTGDYTTKTAKAAASTAVLKREVSGLATAAGRGDKRLEVLSQRVGSLGVQSMASRGQVASVSREIDMFGRSLERTNTNLEKTGSLVDRTSGRLQLYAQAAAVFAPGLAPIGAVGIPALTGLASAAGFAALAGGTMIGVFQGVGDALKAVNEAALEPTEANLEKARVAMEKLSPAAQSFVTRLREFMPALKELRDLGAENMFPGFEAGLDGLEAALPRVERFVEAMSSELGDIAADTGESFGSERWAPFLDFLATDGPPAVRDMVTSVGSLTHAAAEMWMAFDPLNDDFSAWMVKSTAQLDEWASGLDQTRGFQEFVDYVRTNGPQVADTMAAVGNAMVQIVQAAAPLGGPVLQAIEAIAKALGSVADSDLGTPIFTALAAMSLYNRGLAASTALQKRWGTQSPVVAGLTRQKKALTSLRSDWAAYGAVTNTAQGRAQASATAIMAQARAGERLGSTLRTTGAVAGKAAAGVGALALVSSGAADGIGLTNTATLALAGTMLGPWGAAAGASIGAFMDLRKAGGVFGETMDSINAALRAGDWDLAARGAAELDKQLAAINDTADRNKWSGVFETIKDDIKGLAGVMRGDLQFDDFWAGTFKQGADRAREEAEERRLASERRASVGREAAAGAQLRSSRLTALGYKNVGLAAMASSAQIRTARDAATETGRSFLGLGADVNNAKLSLSGWMRQLEQQNAALRNFATNAIEAGRRGLQDGLLKQLQDAGPEGALRLKQLANATDREINRANRAYVRGEQAIDQYNDAIEQGMTGAVGKVTVFSNAIRRLPKAVQTEIKQNGLERTQAAVVELTRRYGLARKDVRTLIMEQGGRPTKAVIDAVIAAAKNLDRQRPTPRLSALDRASSVIRGVMGLLNDADGRVATSTIRINTLRTTTFSVGGVRAVADGGPVFAALPGETRGARDDTIPAMLSHREFVQPVAAVDWYGERFMEDVRQRRLPKIPGYADGGSVRGYASGGLAGRTKDELYAMAKRRDIDGRSTMNKAELVRALTAGTRNGTIAAHDAVSKKRGGSPYSLTPKERSAANKAFDIGKLSVKGTNRKLAAFERQINRSGGRVGRNFDGLSRRIVRNAAEFGRLGTEINGLKERRDEARSTAKGAFNNDIYSGSLADLRTRLEADRNDSNASAAAVAEARGRGLKGDFGASVAGSGNLALAQELANASSSEIAQLQALYAQRISAQNNLGNQAAAAMNTVINKLAAQQAQTRRTLEGLERAVERGARNGTQGRQRAVATKSKAKGRG